MFRFTSAHAVLIGLFAAAAVVATARTPALPRDALIASHAPASMRAQPFARTPNALRPPGSVLAAMSAPTGPLTAEPTVPRPDSAPCVVELFNGLPLTGFDGFSYTPPEGCPAPWAKVVFEMDMASIARTGSVGNVRVLLGHPDDGDFVLFMGAPQIHDGVHTWRVERDLTDYTALLARPGLMGSIEHTWDNSSPSVDEDRVSGSARIKFYPATAAQPAPRVPDVMFTHDHASRMPRNIVRAYVEVLAQGLDQIGTSDRLWYTCTLDFFLDPTSGFPGINNPFSIGDDWGATLSSSAMGCDGGSYRDVEVLLDGVVVGTAPIFPWLPSNLHRRFADSVDRPVPSAQALNFIPYRVDITPFAALLNDGALHTVSLRVVGDPYLRDHFQLDGKLLAWVDFDTAIVRGGVTRNTLVPLNVYPTAWCSRDVDKVTCQTNTVVKRDYRIEGFVDTSAGRIYSRIDTHSDFKNVQHQFVDGIFYPNYRGYKQFLDLQSRVHTTSQRVLAGTTLGIDEVSVRYPLRLDFASAGRMVDNGEGGYVADFDSFGVRVDQAREQKTDQQRGAVNYTSTLRDEFAGEHLRNNVVGTDPIWRSKRTYSFRDSLGDCFVAHRTTIAGAMATASTGGGCPGGVNRMLWFVRPDGSPENLGWVP